MKHHSLPLLLILVVGLVASASAAVTQYNSTIGSETVWLFNGTGSVNVQIPSNGTAWVLIVAGGASGGSGVTGTLNGAGGGGGGILNGTITTLSGGSYTITVGTGGGARSAQQQNGENGGNSVFSTWTAFGGGFGAQSGPSTNYNGGQGGSGGGGARSGGVGGTSSQTTQSPLTGYGYAGGTNSAVGQGAGGGGATQAGGVSYGTYAQGITSTITGSSKEYGKGGAGAGTIAGAAGTGNGGDGQDDISFAGGSGVVIIRFTETSEPPAASFSLQLIDTSSNLPTSWNWTVKNLLGNNTEIPYSTSQNPVLTLPVGNWEIKLTAQNIVGSTSTTKTMGFNLSSPQVYFWNRTS